MLSYSKGVGGALNPAPLPSACGSAAIPLVELVIKSVESIVAMAVPQKRSALFLYYVILIKKKRAGVSPLDENQS